MAGISCGSDTDDEPYAIYATLCAGCSAGRVRGKGGWSKAVMCFSASCLLASLRLDVVAELRHGGVAVTWITSTRRSHGVEPRCVQNVFRARLWRPTGCQFRQVLLRNRAQGCPAAS